MSFFFFLFHFPLGRKLDRSSQRNPAALSSGPKVSLPSVYAVENVLLTGRKLEASLAQTACWLALLSLPMLTGLSLGNEVS